MFARAPLTIEECDGNIGGARQLSARQKESPSQAAIDTKARMTTFLSRRYYEQTKVLDLSKLGIDADLVEMGMFNSTSTESKFFPALMKVCELSFDSPEKREDAVAS